MKYHLILIDRTRCRPPPYIWLANGDKAVFVTGHKMDENALHGLVIASVTPSLEEWPTRLAQLIKARMLPYA